MNTFEYSFHIGDNLYSIYVDSSKDEWKKIIINNREVVSEKYTLALNRDAYIIYYPIDIAGNELVVSIDDNMLAHTYNLYFNNVSLLDGTRLDEQYLVSRSIVEKGFSSYFRENWFAILKDNLLAIIGSVIAGGVIYNYVLDQFIVKFLLSFIIVPLALPAFVAGEWFHNKNIMKKYKSCFRPKKIFNKTEHGSIS